MEPLRCISGTGDELRPGGSSGRGFVAGTQSRHAGAAAIGRPARAGGDARMRGRGVGRGVLMLLVVVALAPAPLGQPVHGAAPAACVGPTAVAAATRAPCVRRRA